MTIKHMNEENKTSENEQIKKLLEQNLELTKEIYRMTRKMKSYITFQKAMSIFYFLLIVVPIILSIIYLPPFFKDMYDHYKSIFGVSAGGSGGSAQDLLKNSAGNLNLNNINVNQLPATVKKLLNK